MPKAPWACDPHTVRRLVMRGRLVFGAGTVAVIVAVGSCTDNVGPTEVENFVANLSGAKERPTPVTTTASGVAYFSHVGNLVIYRVEVTGIDSAFAAHIHAPADTGASIGVAVGLLTLAGPTRQKLSGAGGEGGVGGPDRKVTGFPVGALAHRPP